MMPLPANPAPASRERRRAIGAAHDLPAALERWFLSGACQAPSGAYCAWREASTGRLAFEYPEITGYALTFAAGLEEPAAEHVAGARRAADWLVGRLRAGDYSARTGWDGGAIYTFDLAMIATGLIAFGSRFGGASTEEGLRVVELLVREGEAAGRVPAVARGPRAAHAGWATEGRAHLLKVVQCLLLADEVAGLDGVWLAEALIDEASMLQQPDGSFVTQPGDGVAMLHPHHYALEGLWVWGSARSDEQALERARSGLRWAFDQQLPTGGLPRLVGAGGEPGPEQLDATAQAVRLAALLDVRPPGLERAVRRLVETSVGDGDREAIPYRPAARHENAWATLFAAQALALAARAPARLRWSELV